MYGCKEGLYSSQVWPVSKTQLGRNKGWFQDLQACIASLHNSLMRMKVDVLLNVVRITRIVSYRSESALNN